MSDNDEGRTLTLNPVDTAGSLKSVNSIDPIEDLAAHYGWRSDGEKSAEEYVKVALEKFPEQSKKIKQLFTAVEDLKVHLSKTEKVAYERARADLDAQRREAISNGDVELVDKLDQARAELTPSTAENEQHPAIADFEGRYSKLLQGTSFEELKIQQWIESHGAILGRKKLPVDEHMSILEDHMKKEFPGYFGGEDESASPKAPVSSTRSNVASSKPKGKITFNDLPQVYKDTAKRYERLGIMSIDKYIDDLVKNGDI